MYSKEEIEKAQSMSLLDYVEMRGYELLRSKNQVRLKEHDSLVISNNKWKWFSQNKGGGTLDFLITYENKGFIEAMKILLEEKEVTKKISKYIRPKVVQKVIDELPEKNSNYRRVYAYLGKTRGIDYNIITDMVKKGLLYEDKEHSNCVFLGKDTNKDVKYGLKIGTTTDKKYKGELPGSDKRYNIEINNSTKNSTVCLYESVIDGMSHASLLKLQRKNYKDINMISLGGVSDLKLEQYLKDNPNIKTIICCLDNDDAGIKANMKIREKYNKLGYAVKAILTKRKDMNEELLYYLNTHKSKKTIAEVKQVKNQYTQFSNRKNTIERNVVM